MLAVSCQIALEVSYATIHPLTRKVTTQTTVLNGKAKSLVAPLTVGIHPVHHPFNIYVFFTICLSCLFPILSFISFNFTLEIPFIHVNLHLFIKIGVIKEAYVSEIYAPCN